MTKLKRYPRLWLIFTAFTVMFCRIVGCSDPQTMTMREGDVTTTFVCTSHTDFATGSDKGMTPGETCNIPCPDGSVQKVDMPDVPDPQFLNSHTTSEIQAMYCPGLATATATATVTSTPGATSTATSTPTKRPTATPAPYLSGDVTTCNLTDRYINFPIDPNAADISGLDFEVTIGGVPSTCNVPSSNANILSCTFSQGQTFPAQVIVSVDGFITNDFTFDGGICVTNPVPQDNSGSGNDPALPVEPSPTTDPYSSG